MDNPGQGDGVVFGLAYLLLSCDGTLMSMVKQPAGSPGQVLEQARGAVGKVAALTRWAL
jgi:hypothetical protein